MFDTETQPTASEDENSKGSHAPVLIKIVLVIGGIALAWPLICGIFSALIGLIVTLAQTVLVVGFFGGLGFLWFKLYKGQRRKEAEERQRIEEEYARQAQAAAEERARREQIEAERQAEYERWRRENPEEARRQEARAWQRQREKEERQRAWEEAQRRAEWEEEERRKQEESDQIYYQMMDDMMNERFADLIDDDDW